MGPVIARVVDPPGDAIARVPAAPSSLILLPARCLAFRLNRRHVGGLLLAGPAGTIVGRSNAVSSGPLAWVMNHRHHARRRTVWGQIRMPGSVLESRGGSILASAEAPDWIDWALFAAVPVLSHAIAICAGDYQRSRPQ
jgi:hypothetical protein